MRYFVAIVEHGSLTRAAEVAHVAQPALSQQLAALEAELGVALVHRGAKGVKPTEAGRTLYRHARAILKQIDVARADVKVAGADIAGTVAIGLPTTAAAAFGMPLVRAIRQRYPGVRLQLFESMSGYIAELLNNNRLDFAILFRDTPSRAVELEPLASEALYLVGTPPPMAAASRRRSKPAGDNTIAFDRLADIPLVLPSGSQGLREVLEEKAAQAGIRLKVVADLDSLPILLQTASEGLACTILPASSVVAQETDPGALPVRLIQPELKRVLSLCWPRALPRTSAAEAVADTLREIVSAKVAQGGSLRAVGDA